MLNWMRGVLIGGFLLAVSVVPGQEHKRAPNPLAANHLSSALLEWIGTRSRETVVHSKKKKSASPVRRVSAHAL